MKKYLLICILILAFAAPVVDAQETTVPDLTGLNVPQAAAQLNEAGLKLGLEEIALWTDTATQPQDTINSQSFAPGSLVAWGATVDITVLRAANFALLYDDNDLTIVNLSGKVANTTGLRFASKEGGSASLSVGSRLENILREGQCFQMWTVLRNAPKGIEECRFIQTWIRQVDVSEHFWTQTSGVQQFAVLENGIERATCPAAPVDSQDVPLRCEFYYSATGTGEITPYLYFVYTPDTLIVFNSSPDRWMMTDRTRLMNPNLEGNSLLVGDPSLFRNPEILGDVTRLAPGQCTLLTINQPMGGTPPHPCQVIAQADINPIFAFWVTGIEAISAIDGELHRCPAATAENPVLCILPR